jgi:hypothetical protein
VTILRAADDENKRFSNPSVARLRICPASAVFFIDSYLEKAIPKKLDEQFSAHWSLSTDPKAGNPYAADTMLLRTCAEEILVQQDPPSLKPQFELPSPAGHRSVQQVVRWTGSI